jgi:hypothetical protein
MCTLLLLLLSMLFISSGTCAAFHAGGVPLKGVIKKKQKKSKNADTAGEELEGTEAAKLGKHLMSWA